MASYKKFFLLVCAFISLYSASAVQSSLLTIGTASYDDGTGPADYRLIYDSDQQLTYLDYVRPADTWQNQMEWAAALDLTVTLRPEVFTTADLASEWRLPTIETPDDLEIPAPPAPVSAIARLEASEENCSYDNYRAELACLFYLAMGNEAGSILGENDYGPFISLRSALHSPALPFWTGSPSGVQPSSTRWAFNLVDGRLSSEDSEVLPQMLHALAVHEGVVEYSLPGDISGNGIVGPEDAILGLQVLVGGAPPLISLNGDVNSDGKIGLEDVFTGLSGGTIMTIPPTDPMTTEERFAVIQNVETLLNDLITNATLPPVTTPVDQRDLAAEMKIMAQELVQIPEVLTVIIDQSGIMATVLLADGFSFFLGNARAPQASSTVLSETQAPAPAPELSIESETASIVQTASPASSSIPGTNKAVFVAIDGGQEVADELFPLITANGYTLVTASGSIEAMRDQYKDLGFLYLDTHGVSYQLITPQIDAVTGKITDLEWGALLYGVQTDSLVSQTDLTTYKDALAAGEIIVSVVPSQTQNKFDFKFAVTERFIERNWSFDHGAVILHTCFGGAGPFTTLKLLSAIECYGVCPALESLGKTVLDPRPLREAILASGAEILMSFDDFTWATSAKPSMKFFIDRLIGADDPEYRLSPKVRPFDWNRIKNEMDQRGLMDFNHGNRLVNLTIDTNGGSPLLAPTIQYMNIVDDIQYGPGSLTLEGLFGDATGMLEANGSALSISSWTNTQIEALIPYDASPTSGSVVAKTPSGTKSNEVPLTEWEGTVTLTQTENGLESRAQVNLFFRADVHKFRTSSAADPEERLVKTYISPRTSGTVTGSGTYTNNGTIIEHVTSSNPASRNMTILGKLAVDNLGGSPAVIADSSNVTPSSLADGVSEFAGVLTLDPENDQAELCMWMLGFHDLRIDGTLFDAGGLIQLGSGVADRTQGFLQCIMMPLNDDYTISADQRSQTISGQTTTLEWTQFIPTSPPDANTKS